MRRKRELDVASLLTLPLGIVIVLAAQFLEGGAPRALLQGPAALIVFRQLLTARGGARRARRGRDIRASSR